MALYFIDSLIVVVEQGRFNGVTLNVINGMINSMPKTNVIFLLQVIFQRRNS